MSIITEEQKNSFEDLAEHVTEYLDTRWDLLVLNFTEKALNAATAFASALMLGLFGSSILLLVGIGAAIWVGQSMGNYAAGFFIVAGIYALLVLLAIVFARNYIRTVLTDNILASIKDDDENEESTY